MKIIIVLFSFFLFIGCEDNNYSQDSTSGVPSCDQQFNKFQNCFYTQQDSVPCDSSFSEGQVIGEKISFYCRNLHFAPDFKETCKAVALERLPEFMKQGVQRAIDRCLP